MTVTIKLPDGEPGKPVAVAGTKIFTHDGHEIENVTRIRIDWDASMVAEAIIDVAVTPDMSLENVHAMLGTETLEQIADMHGYDLVKKEPIEYTPIATRQVHKRRP